MRFLLDQNVDRRLVPYLREQGHDVTVVSIDYPAGISDREVLAHAHGEDRIVVTNDSDFGELVVRHNLPHAGIIYLRLNTATFDAKRDRLAAVLRQQADRLDQFLTVTESAVRVRRARGAD